MKGKIAISLSAIILTGVASAQIVTPNNPSGDYFSNAGSSNQGQAVGTSGFFYNNVRNGGTVGINTEIARNGNGSAYFKSEDGSDKADFEFLAQGTNFAGNFFAAGSLGKLGDLEALSYSWYRKGTSTTTANFQPALRILVDADGNVATTGDRGGLVFEIAYNGSATAATDTWVSEDIFGYNSGAGANMWTFGAGMSTAQEGYGVKISDWQAGLNTISANSVVLGFSMGVGSGWANGFEGAVDDLSFKFAGQNAQTFNFEAVPEPGTMAALFAGLAGIAARRKRSKK